MKYFTLIAACLLGGAAAAEEFPGADVKARCATQYPYDFFMQKSCFDLQRMSFYPGTAGLPEDIATAITEKCTADYQGDFFMQDSCIDLQATSWRDLNQ